MGESNILINLEHFKFTILVSLGLGKAGPMDSSVTHLSLQKHWGRAGLIGMTKMYFNHLLGTHIKGNILVILPQQLFTESCLSLQDPQETTDEKPLTLFT